MSGAALSDEDDIGAIDPAELREAARRLLSDRVDRREGWSRAPAKGGSALRQEMAELGWLLLTVPAASGGLGQRFTALAPIYEEIGRALAPLTIAGTMAAVDVLAEEGGDIAGALLERVVAGEARVVVAFADLPDGPAADVVFGAIADVADATDLLILPDRADGSALLVDLGADGAAVAPVVTWDRTRTFGDVRLTAAPLRLLTGSGSLASRVARAHTDLAMAWDCIGGAEQTLAEAIAYMGTRRQFNRPIGSFQALKHRSADLKVGLEIARALTHHASDAFAARGPGWSDLAGQARLLAVDAYRAIAEDGVQFHGGIGFTWEQDSHLFLKRALMNEMLGGTPEQTRDRVAPGILKRALARS